MSKATSHGEILTMEIEREFINQPLGTYLICKEGLFVLDGDDRELKGWRPFKGATHVGNTQIQMRSVTLMADDGFDVDHVVITVGENKGRTISSYPLIHRYISSTVEYKLGRRP